MRKVIPWILFEEFTLSGACQKRIAELQESWDTGIPFTRTILRTVLEKNGLLKWDDIEWIMREALTPEAWSDWWNKMNVDPGFEGNRELNLTWRFLNDRDRVSAWWRVQVLDWKPRQKEATS